jgi:hypothetical protein
MPPSSGLGKKPGYTQHMADLHASNSAEHRDEPGTTRTWWHPLLARLLDHVLATAYRVLEEVYVGRIPLRLDILLIRRETGQLSEANRRDLVLLLPLLNRFTLVQFKGPTDALQRGDLAHLVGCAMLWHSQQVDPISRDDISLVVLAPTLNQAMRDELQLLGCDIHEREAGIFGVVGLPFSAWLVENDEMAKRGQPILSLVSRVFLRDRERIIEQLTDTGHLGLLYYMLQQVQQFRRAGEAFAMQHKDLEYMGEVEEELQMAVLDAIPPEERLRGLRPKEWLSGVSFEELVSDLSEEQRARLRELLDRQSGC